MLSSSIGTASHLTEPSAILEPAEPLIDRFYEAQKFQSTDSEVRVWNMFCRVTSSLVYYYVMSSMI